MLSKLTTITTFRRFNRLSMIFEETNLKGAFQINPEPFEDNRGFFARWFCEKEFSQRGLESVFLQCNQSGTSGLGSIRGMHFQMPPFSEVKLVKCIVGSIYDVIVDVRKDSPTFLKWYGVKLSAKTRNMLYIPKGFAHGFQTLEEESEIIYMVSSVYSKNHENGIRYDDQAVKIDWPLERNKISEKDLAIQSIDRSNFTGIEL